MTVKHYKCQSLHSISQVAKIYKIQNQSSFVKNVQKQIKQNYKIYFELQNRGANKKYINKNTQSYFYSELSK